MKLEYLSPYLPYKLILMSNCGEVELTTSNIESCLDNSLKRKPILKPLSDLTKDNEVTTEFQLIFKENDDIIDYLCEEKGDVSKKNIPYQLAEWLFKNHFDVFGLIEKGLAIDINTINKQS